MCGAAQVMHMERKVDHFVCCIKRVCLIGLSPQEYSEAMNEVDVLSRCRHVNIVAVCGSLTNLLYLLQLSVT